MNSVNCQWCGKQCHPNDVEYYSDSMHGVLPPKPYCMRCWDANHEIIKAGGTPFSSVVPGRKLPNGATIILFEAHPEAVEGVVLAMWEKNYGWEYICWRIDPQLGCFLGYYHRGTAEGLAAALDQFKERVATMDRRRLANA